MYTVFLEDKLLMNPEENLLLISPVVSLEDNAAGEFTFQITPDHSLFSDIRQAAHIRVMNQDEVLFSGRIIEIRKEFSGVLSVKAEGDLAYLDDSIQRQRELHNISVRGFLELLIESHNKQSQEQFELGIVTVTDPNDSLYRYTNYESTLACIQSKLVDTLGGHLRVRYEDRRRILDYLKDYPHQCRQPIRFKENLLDYADSASLLDIATVLIPLGASLEDREIEALDSRVTIASVNDGSDAIESPEAIEKYGRITKVITFDDISTPSLLKRRGEEWLEKNRFASLAIEVTAADLSLLDADTEPFHLLDLVPIESDYHNLHQSFPLRQMSIHLLQPDQNTYTLGNDLSSFVNASSKAQISTTKRIDKIPLPSSLLKQARDEATALIRGFGKEGHIVFVQDEEGNIQELCIIDSDSIETARKVWRFNMGGLGFSNNGYGGPYETAITMDGTIVGNLIAAHTIGGDKIDVAYTTEQEKKWKDELGKNYSTTTQITNAINSSAEGVKIYSVEQTTEKLKSYYTKSEIDVTVNGISSTVSKKVGSSEIISKINQSAEGIKIQGSKLDVDADSIRLQAKNLQWSSTNSSMTTNGTLTCSNANINGTFTCGSSSYSNLKITGGELNGYYGSTLQGSIKINDGFWAKYYTATGEGGDMIGGRPFSRALSVNAETFLLDVDNLYMKYGSENGYAKAYKGITTTASVGGKVLEFKNGILIRCQ